MSEVGIDYVLIIYSWGGVVLMFGTILIGGELEKRARDDSECCINTPGSSVLHSTSEVKKVTSGFLSSDCPLVVKPVQHKVRTHCVLCVKEYSPSVLIEPEGNSPTPVLHL